MLSSQFMPNALQAHLSWQGYMPGQPVQQGADGFFAYHPHRPALTLDIPLNQFARTTAEPSGFVGLFVGETEPALPTRRAQFIEQALSALRRWQEVPSADFDFARFIMKAELISSPFSERTAVLARWDEIRQAGIAQIQAEDLMETLYGVSHHYLGHGGFHYGISDTRIERLMEYSTREYLSSHHIERPHLTDLICKASGNCSARMKFVIALFTALRLRLSRHQHLGIQVFADHVEPVIYDAAEDSRWALTGGHITKDISTSIYHPMLILYAFLKRNGVTPPVSEDELILRKGDLHDAIAQNGSHDAEIPDDGFRFPSAALSLRTALSPREARLAPPERYYDMAQIVSRLNELIVPGLPKAATQAINFIALVSLALFACYLGFFIFAQTYEPADYAVDTISDCQDIIDENKMLMFQQAYQSWIQAQLQRRVDYYGFGAVYNVTNPIVGSDLLRRGLLYALSPSKTVCFQTLLEVRSFQRMGTLQRAAYLGNRFASLSRHPRFQESLRFLRAPHTAAQTMRPEELKRAIQLIGEYETDSEGLMNFVRAENQPVPLQAENTLREQLNRRPEWEELFGRVAAFRIWVDEHPRDFLIYLNSLPPSVQSTLLENLLDEDRLIKVIIYHKKIIVDPRSDEVNPYSSSQGPISRLPGQVDIEVVDAASLPNPTPTTDLNPQASPPELNQIARSKQTQTDNSAEPNRTVTISPDTALALLERAHADRYKLVPPPEKLIEDSALLAALYDHKLWTGDVRDAYLRRPPRERPYAIFAGFAHMFHMNFPERPLPEATQALATDYCRTMPIPITGSGAGFFQFLCGDR